MIGVDRDVDAGLPERPQSDEMGQALASEPGGQGVRILVVTTRAACRRAPPGARRGRPTRDGRSRRESACSADPPRDASPAAASNASSTASTPASPVTCATICHPCSWPMAMAERICSGVSVRTPRYAGSSIAYRSWAPGPYGSRMNAVPSRIPPSTTILSGPTFSQSSPLPNLSGRPVMNRSTWAASSGCGMRNVTVARTCNRPARCSAS